MAEEKTDPTAVKAVASAANKPKQKRSIVRYFKDARSEFKKVVWPSRKQVINNTIVVIISLVVSGLAVWGLDTLFITIFKLVLGRTD